MPQQNSDKQVTFCDIAASFSEEEWKLLHEWQKELYRNVMKDIQQAVISLGPLIAASVFSLSAKENEDLHPADHQVSDSKQCIDDCAIISIRIKEEEENYSLENLDSEMRESKDSPTAGARTTENNSSYTAKDKEKKTSNATSRKYNINVFPSLEIEDGIKQCHDVESNPKNTNLVTFGCTECEQSFLLEDDLHQHQETHVDETPSASTDPLKGLNIKMYQKKPEKKREQLRHTVVRPYLCSVCEKRFSQKGSLKRHQRIHTGVRYPCSECEKSFTRKEMLIIHKRTHTGEKPFQCTECGKRFSHKGYLFSHKNQHAEEKPFKCDECGKTFGNKGTLRIHKRLHTGYKPFQCSYCEKSFSQKGYLSIHEKTHIGEKPYQCTECGKHFSRKRHLILHKGTHLHEKRCQQSEIEINLQC